MIGSSRRFGEGLAIRGGDKDRARTQRRKQEKGQALHKIDAI